MMSWRNAISKVLETEIKKQKLETTKVSSQAFEGRNNVLSKFFRGSRQELAPDEISNVGAVLGLELEEIIARAKYIRGKEELALDKAEDLLKKAKEVGLKDTLMDTLKLIVEPDLYDSLAKEAEKLNGKDASESPQQAAGD
jgi:hypothetical protein